MDINKCFALNFTVSYILFRNKESGFTIIDARILSIPDSEQYTKKNVVIKGLFNKIEAGDSFSCHAEWVYDKKYGKQIEAYIPSLIIPSDLSGIKKFLAKAVPGIGKVTADKIVKKYGLEAIDKIKESPLNLSCIKGISEKKALSIHNKLNKSEHLEELTVFLFKNGLSSFNDVSLIYSKLGDEAESIIVSNPYSLCDYISISWLPKSDKLSLNMGNSLLSRVRISKLILYYISSHCYSSGDMFMTLDYLLHTILTYLQKSGFSTVGITTDLIKDALSYLEDSGAIIIDSSFNELPVYLKSLYVIESNTAKVINSLVCSEKKVLTDEVYDSFFCEYTKNTGLIIDSTQKKAVKMAYENKFSVLTGGPGTGKTQTINAIISFIKKNSPSSSIMLCAPTGRAAKRMSELTGMESFTIHRLLGLYSGENSEESYLELDKNQLEADFVICDESSMIDASLFYKLISAVSDCGSSLLLVGDKDQLPPVGSGLPFKDIIESRKIPSVTLKTLYRQASQSQINRNANLILSGCTVFGDDGLSFNPALQDFFYFDTSDYNMQKTLILNSIDQLLKVGSTLEDIMVLSPVIKGELGVIELNKMIQNHLNPEHPSKREYMYSSFIFRENDRVMQSVNNYDKYVFNGDIGIIDKINIEKEEIIVSFDDTRLTGNVLTHEKRYVTYSFSEASELMLAYSVTIHKAQGSEYPIVIMPLSPSFFNLSRNIIYTAITRAKKRMILIGDRPAFISGIIKNDNIKRFTFLKERLKSTQNTED